MRAPEIGAGARSRRRLQLHHGFTANKTGVPASGGLSTLVPGALGPQRSRRSSRRPIPPGRSRPRRGSKFSIGPARAGPTRESALAIAGASAPPPAISESTCVHSLSLWELLRAPRWTSQPTLRANPTPFFALSVAATSVHRPSRCAPRHHRPPPRVAAGLSLPSHHRLRPTAARAPHRPSTRAPPQVEATYRHAVTMTPRSVPTTFSC